MIKNTKNDLNVELKARNKVELDYSFALMLCVSMTKSRHCFEKEVKQSIFKDLNL